MHRNNRKKKQEEEDGRIVCDAPRAPQEAIEMQPVKRPETVVVRGREYW